jgi:hypothetical protein
VPHIDCVTGFVCASAFACASAIGRSPQAVADPSAASVKSEDGAPIELPKADRDILFKTLLHAADISNPCKTFDLARSWSDRVTTVGAGPWGWVGAGASEGGVGGGLSARTGCEWCF